MPSTLLDARSITRHHGTRTVLQDVDVRVDATTRLALIGPNGSGKSTLLRALAGLEPLDGGSVQRFGTVGYLPQLADHRGSPTTAARRPSARRSSSASAWREPHAFSTGSKAV